MYERDRRLGRRPAVPLAENTLILQKMFMRTLQDLFEISLQKLEIVNVSAVRVGQRPASIKKYDFLQFTYIFADFTSQVSFRRTYSLILHSHFTPISEKVFHTLSSVLYGADSKCVAKLWPWRIQR